MTGACIWCGTAFAPRTTGGSTQRFCSRDCRQDFYTACRTWGVQEYEAGRLPMSELRGCVAQRARLLQCDPGLERCQVPAREDRGGGAFLATDAVDGRDAAA